MSARLLAAIKRRHRTPESAMAALGLDASLLNETRAEVRLARTRRRLAADAGEVVLPDPDDDGPDSEQVLAALKSILASGRLGDAQKAWLLACLNGEEVSDDPPAPDDVVAQDDPVPFPGRPNPGGKLDAIRTQAQDTAFDRRFPNAARIGLGAATAPPTRRGLTSRSASSKAMAAFASRYPNAARIKLG